MSVKAGQILHVGSSFLIDRIQTAGPGNLNIPEEKVYELGNYKTVGFTRDRPDLTFDLESLDMSTEIEAIVTGADPAAVVDGAEFDFNDAKPIDIISPFKDQGGSFQSVRGVVLPFLTLESVTYRFGLRQNATQSFSLKGDSIFYVPGTPYYEEFTAAAPVAGPYVLAHAATIHNRGAEVLYVLGLCVRRANGTYERLFFGVDYTNTAADFSLTPAGAAKVAVGDKLNVVYGSVVPATWDQVIHPTPAVKPAAIRGKDIDVYVGPAGGPLLRWAGVQSAEASRRVNLDADEEFGNVNAVTQDYDTADVTGNIGVRPGTVQYLWTLIHQVTGVPADEVVGTDRRVPLELEVRVSDPITGDRLKTLVCEDAIFQPPPIQPRVQQKLETTFNWTSEGGDLRVYAGERP